MKVPERAQLPLFLLCLTLAYVAFGLLMVP